MDHKELQKYQMKNIHGMQSDKEGGFYYFTLHFLYTNSIIRILSSFATSYRIRTLKLTKDTKT